MVELQDWQRYGLFILGAAILFVEIEFKSSARGWVIGLAAVMMGIVSVDQAVHWIYKRINGYGDHFKHSQSPASDPSPHPDPPPRHPRSDEQSPD